jgi:hypothetical protein
VVLKEQFAVIHDALDRAEAEIASTLDRSHR